MQLKADEHERLSLAVSAASAQPISIQMSAVPANDADKSTKKTRSRMRKDPSALQQSNHELCGSNKKPEEQRDSLAHLLALTRSIFEVTSDAIVVTSQSGDIVDFNQQYLRLWSIDGEAVIGHSFCAVMTNLRHMFISQVASLARFADIVDSEVPETLDVLTLSDDRILEYSSRTQRVAERRVGRVWSFRDITANIRSEQALRDLNATLEQRVIERSNQLLRSEQQFDQLVAGIQDCAIYMLDPRGHLASWNPGAQRIKGYRADEVIGKHFSLFFSEEDRRKGFPQQALELARANGKYETEAWRIRKDGTRFWASVLIDAIFDPSGKLMGFAKITRDMTERRALQEQLHQAQKMETIGQMTGGIAHDFNNLLTVISGNLERLRTQLPDASQLHRSVEQATRGAQRAATLTQQLLAFSRRQPLNPKPTNVNRLIINSTNLFRPTLPESIAINTILGTDLKAVEVDPHQLESALLNLAVNARDAMPHGGKLTVETMNMWVTEDQAKYAEVAPGEYVVIRISDNGIGMSEEILARAFEPFFTTKRIGSGTGLGLSQVYGFVKQSGGNIKIYSDVGQGTTVKIYLTPLMNGEVEIESDEEVVVDSIKTGETILVVEDDADVRSYSTETLRDLGYTVLDAENATRALQLLDLHPEVQLLFTDVGLPGLDGKELAEEALRRGQQLRVLFTSGYARSTIVHAGRVDPGVRLLTKPFTSAQLAARIREVLDAPRNGV